MYKKILFMALIMSQWSLVNSQTISRKSISSAGSTLTGGSYMLTFNIGETVIPTLSAGGTVVAEGFEQPGEQIQTGIIPATACVGTAINVPFTATDLLATNTYTVQLSDATGSFASPTNIGTLAGNSQAATIVSTIPANTPAGNGYKIRVVGSVPLTIGTSSANITFNPLTTVSTSVSNVLCNGGNTGKVIVLATGGTGAISYTISPLVGYQSPSGTFNGLTAQTYTFTATDANGCAKTTTAQVTQPTAVAFTSNPSVTNVTCMGGSDGRVVVAASGGTGAISYAINPNTGLQNPAGTFNGLTAQTYTFTATDANSCKATTTAAVGTKVNTPPTISITSPTNGSVFATNKTITVNAADPDGSIAKVNFYLVIYGDKTPISRTLLGSSTTIPYSFEWSNIVGGNYNIQAEAVDNCGATTFSTVAKVIVLETCTVSITSPTTGQGFVPGSNLTLAASVISYTNRTIVKVEFFKDNTKLGEDLTAPYTYFWTNVQTGTYSLRAIATDNLGGVWSSPYTYIIGINPPNNRSTHNGHSSTAAFTLFPNPTKGEVNINTTIVEEGNYNLNVMDMMGRIVVAKQMTYSKGDMTERLDVSSLAKGIYVVRLVKASGKDAAIQKLIIE
jgi:Secretion system C-terminal sorting domain/Bacterial Ig domain/SprB repeat